MHFGLEQGFGVSSNTKFGSLLYLFLEIPIFNENCYLF